MRTLLNNKNRNDIIAFMLIKDLDLCGVILQTDDIIVCKVANSRSNGVFGVQYNGMRNPTTIAYQYYYDHITDYTSSLRLMYKNELKLINKQLW